MRRAIWSPEAQQHLRAALQYIGEDNPAIAERVILRIVEAAEKLARTDTGRPGRRTGTREKLVSGLPYFIIYEMRADEVHILQILHTAQLYPPR